jgi:hypothetical protein
MIVQPQLQLAREAAKRGIHRPHGALDALAQQPRRLGKARGRMAARQEQRAAGEVVKRESVATEDGDEVRTQRLRFLGPQGQQAVHGQAQVIRGSDQVHRLRDPGRAPSRLGHGCRGDGGDGRRGDGRVGAGGDEPPLPRHPIRMRTCAPDEQGQAPQRRRLRSARVEWIVRLRAIADYKDEVHLPYVSGR